MATNSNNIYWILYHKNIFIKYYLSYREWEYEMNLLLFKLKSYERIFPKITLVIFGAHGSGKTSLSSSFSKKEFIEVAPSDYRK